VCDRDGRIASEPRTQPIDVDRIELDRDHVPCSTRERIRQAPIARPDLDDELVLGDAGVADELRRDARAA
jgi:hypothetical protein